MYKSIIAFVTGISLLLIPTVVFATATSWDYNGTVLQPLVSQKTIPVKAANFIATSTTATSTLKKADFTGPTIGILGEYFTNFTNYIRSRFTATSPIAISGSGVVSITNSAADGSTKGAASFAASDFDASSGNVSLDYTNGQKASGSQPGFLSLTDWTTFNNKQGAITLTTTGSSGAATFVGNTLNVPQYAGTTYTGTFPISITGSVISDLFSTTSNSGMSQGFQYVGSGGIFKTAASSSLFGYTPLNPTRNINTTYPLQGGGDLSADRTLTTAFGTTTNTGISAGSLYIGSGGIFQTTATTTVTCTGNASCSPFSVLGSTPITINVAAGTAASSTLLGDTNTFSGTDTFSNNIKVASINGLFGGNGGTTYQVSTSTLNIGGNAGTATALATGRTLSITGDLAYTSPSFDGSGNVTAAGTLATVNSNVGSFTNANVTVNAKGLVTAVSNGTAPTTYTGTYPIQVSGSVISTGFGTTSPWGLGNNGFVITGPTGIPFVAASSTLNLPTSALASANISQFTNDAGYDTFAYPFIASATTSALTFGGVTITGKSDGCATFASGVLNSTGTACGSGGGGGAAYPFTPSTQFGINTSATTTALQLTGGLTASSTSWISQLFVGSTTPQTFTNAPLVVSGNTNNYVQAILQNTNSGNTASADFIVGGDLMTNSVYYGDLGYNSSVNADPSFTAFGPNALYLYNSDGDVSLATASTTNTSAALKFFTGGSLTANERARFTSTGLFGIGTTSPFAQVAIHALFGSTNTTLFAIGSSSLAATTTLFSIDNTGGIRTNLSGSGFVKTTGAGSLLTVDTSTYLTGNQTATLSGVVTGSGATAITTSFASVNANTFLANNTGASAAPTFIATSSIFGTGTPGQHLAWLGGVPKWVATTTFSVTTNQGVSGAFSGTSNQALSLTLGALTGVTSFNGLAVTANTGVITTGTWSATAIAVNKGGTNNTATPSSMLLAYDNAGTTIQSTSTPQAAAFLATSTTATSTFQGGLSVGTTTNAVGGTVSAMLTIANGVKAIGGLLINTWTNVVNAFSIVNAAGTTVFNVDTTSSGAFLGVGTTTPEFSSDVFDVANSTQTATTTLSLGSIGVSGSKVQFNIKNSAGADDCMFVNSANVLTVISGKCNP